MHCLIIDDNPKTSSILSGMLEAIPVVEEVHKAVQPYLVRSLMAAERIDVVFIRVRLWDFRQFEKLDRMPVMVFLTGGKDKLTIKQETTVPYALREPYHSYELLQLMTKIITERKSETPTYLFLRYDGRFHRTAFSDIELVEAKQGSYVQFHLKGASKLVSGYLGSWLPKLPADKFIRVSDTLIVPVSEVSRIKDDEYEYKGRIFKLTFRFAAAARKEMEKWPGGL